MDTVADHSHSFLPSAWPFAEPINALVYTSTRVLRDAHPILVVFHDHDGDWQFLHGEVGEDDECKIICLGCIFERDSSVGILNDLPLGWKASRKSIKTPWQSEPYEASDEV
jgi:hypothetical protein